MPNGPSLTRRQFTATAAAFAANGLSGTRLMAKASPASLHLATLERPRLLAAANRYLTESPITITASQAPRSTGGLHDFFSEGDYWWPDPRNPTGPYIRRDGFSNPANFVAHRQALLRLSVQMPALTAAWRIAPQNAFAKKCAAHAAEHLRAWFVTPATRMNPNLEHAQAISGVTSGRGVGIIDTLHLVEVVRAATLLDEAGLLHPNDSNAIRSWFTEYLAWMSTSKNGIEERDARNNHGSCWVLQAAEFARYTRNPAMTQLCIDRFRNNLIPDQVAPDGSLPLELARTKPYSYSLFCLDVLTTICQVIGSQPNTPDLWHFTPPGKSGIEKAVAFMAPYIRDKKSWPHPPDVEYFNDLPVRQPNLLFAGLAYHRPDYIALWQTLPADPTVDEIIRNFPIRQPVLWVAPHNL